MFGQVPSPVWTQLAHNSTIDPNTTLADNLTLDVTPDWQAGQQFVVASTDFDQDQAEVRTLSSRSGPMLFVGQEFDYVHWGRKLYYNTSYEIDERAEVAVLTRNVVVMGENRPEAVGVPNANFYPHLLFQKGTDTSNPPNEAAAPTIRFCAVEFTLLGTERAMGRYPIHFHLLGDRNVDGNWKKAFVVNCSVHDVFNRGIVVHETQGVRIENNVVYNTVGHAYYFEDPYVARCMVKKNLGLVTHRADVTAPDDPPDACNCIPADTFDGKPSVFYVPNPSNEVEDNVAAGAFFAGFYFEPPNVQQLAVWTPDGPMTFTGNVAHSCGDYPDADPGNGGFGVYQDTVNRLNSNYTQVFEDTLTYKCRWHGMWIRSLGKVEIQDSKFADNRSGLYPATVGDREPGDGYFKISGCVFIGETINKGDYEEWNDYEDNPTVLRSLPQTKFDMTNFDETHEERWDILCGIEMYDGYNEISDCSFLAFQDMQIESLHPQVDPGEPFTPDWRLSGAFCQVSKASAWAVDPRNQISMAPVLFDTTVKRKVYMRNGGADSEQIHNTLVYDVAGQIDPWSGSNDPGYYLPKNPFLVDGNAAAIASADNVLGGESLNGYWVPDAAVAYAQLYVKASPSAGVLPDLMRIRRDPTRSGGTGVTYDCHAIPEQLDLNSSEFAVNLQTSEALPSGKLAYYSFDLFSQGTTAFLPKDITINYYFAEAAGEVLYVELPFANTAQAQVAGSETFVNEFTTLDQFLADSRPNLWYAQGGRVYLKMTSAFGQNTQFDGTEVWARVVLVP